MSHSVAMLDKAQLAYANVTIVNYAAGGETVTPSEIKVLAVDGLMFATVPASGNSLGVPLFPLLEGGKIKLFRFVSGSPVEIPTTAGLNAVIFVMVHHTAWLS